jgi:hypothetical protein
MAKKDCSELAQSINDAIMNIASRPDVKNLDDAIAKYQQLVPGMTRDMVVDSIVEATEGRSGDPDALANKINRIKQEARTDKVLTAKIEELEAYIKAGAIPATKTRKKQTPPEAIQALRDVRDELKKKLSKSDQVQRARVQAQIDDLTARLKSGDIYPNPKAKQDPKSKELERLEFERDELRREIRNEIQALKPKTLFQKVGGFFDISRDVTLSFDLGAVLRQGGFFLAAKPIASRGAFADMAKATASEQGLAKVDKAIAAHPDIMLFKKAGGFIAPTDGTHRPSQREEAHRSSWAEKYIPGIRMSNRAYVSFLNKMRIDVFSTLTKTLGKNGEVTFEEAQALARFVNIATGRGELGRFSNIAEGLAIPFLAPRYVLSRFQLLGGGITAPLKGVAGSRVHRLIAKEYGKYMIGITLVGALLQMIGDIFDKELTIEKNPLSTDFGKAKIGNTRVDLLSGVGSVTTLILRVALGKTKKASGEIVPIRAGRGDEALKDELESLRDELKKPVTKERQKQIFARIKEVKDDLKAKSVPFDGLTVPKALGSFTRYKFSPLLKTPFDIVSGTNAIGEEVTPKTVILDSLTPLAFRDVVESIEELGLPAGSAVSLAAILGAATNTYGYEVDLRREPTENIKADLEDSVYKRTSRTRDPDTGEIIIRVKGQPHKGKEYKVDALQKELDKRQKSGKKVSKGNDLNKIASKLGIKQLS